MHVVCYDALGIAISVGNHASDKIQDMEHKRAALRIPRKMRLHAYS